MDQIDWVEVYWQLKNEGKLDPNAWFACPCCGYPTKDELGGFDICILCDWEDDGLEYKKPISFVIGGPNGQYSLSEARLNFEKYLIMYGPNDSRFPKQSTVSKRKKTMIELLENFRWKNNIVIPVDVLHKLGWG